MNDEVEKLISLIFSAGRLIKKRTNKFENHNFLLHLKIVDFVNKNKNPTMSELSGFLCVKSPTTTSIVAPLVKLGKIKRISDKADNRVVRLIATKFGKKFIKEGRRKLIASLKADFSKINGKERRDLIKILERIT